MRFTVDGAPEPQGSMRAVLIGGRARIIAGGDDNRQRRHKAWRAAVTRAAVAVLDGAEPHDGPVRVVVTFRMARPAAARRRHLPHVRPDLDKLCRSVLDSLTDAHVVADDGRVCELVARKVYADAEHPPGVDVRIDPIGPDDA